MVELEEEIKKELKGYVNMNFYVVYNFDYKTHKDRDKTYSCVIRLNSHGNLVYGYLKRESKIGEGLKDVIYKLEEEFVDMCNNAKATSYLGYETVYIDKYREKNTYKVMVYPDLKILAILTDACTYAYYAVQTNNNKLNTNVVIEGSNWENFKTDIQAEAILKYEKFISSFLIPRISKKKKFEFFKKDFILVDVNTKEARANLLMFNPFRKFKDFQHVYSQSYYIKACKDAKVEYFNLEFSYLTYQELCYAFGFKKFMRMPFNFSIKLLAGFFNRKFPNTSEKVYMFNNSLAIEGAKKMLTISEYMLLEPHLKPAYTERDTLYLLCGVYKNSIKRSRNIDRTSDIYNICKNRNLIKYVD